MTSYTPQGGPAADMRARMKAERNREAQARADRKHTPKPRPVASDGAVEVAAVIICTIAVCIGLLLAYGLRS